MGEKAQWRMEARGRLGTTGEARQTRGTVGGLYVSPTIMGSFPGSGLIESGFPVGHSDWTVGSCASCNSKSLAEKRVAGVQVGADDDSGLGDGSGWRRVVFKRRNLRLAGRLDLEVRLGTHWSDSSSVA